MESSRSGAPLSLAPLPELGLSPAEKARIRERAQVLGRHCQPGPGGEAVAAHSLGTLLAALRIDDAAQATRPDQGAAWAADFAQPPGPRSGATWAAEFGGGKGSAATAWAADFAAGAAPPAWGVAEFLSRPAESGAAGPAGGGAGVDASVGGPALALATALAADGTPKFRASKLLHFVSKMSRGELVFEGNAVAERRAGGGDGVATGAATAWAHQFADQPAAAAAQAPGAAWASQFAEAGPGGGGGWADAFASLPQRWAAEFAGAGGAGGALASDWASAFDGDVDAALAGAAAEGAARAGGGEGGEGGGAYAFAPANPYAAHPDPLAEGARLYRDGVLSEAALALEAAAAREPGCVAAWVLLGRTHAENDDDPRALAALRAALAVDPANREVLLALGVSATNELDGRAAVGYVAAWLRTAPPPAPGQPRPAPPTGAGLAEVLACARAAADAAPGEAEGHVAVGVLQSVARDYDAAIASFGAALRTRPGDCSLWNKLGAVQANSSRSGEALASYRRALSLKPNYVRAWCNMGIGYANQGAYAPSAAYYVRALQLNPAADAVWGYLRISLSVLASAQGLHALDSRDLGELVKLFPL